jgi:hypothetical protein
MYYNETVEGPRKSIDYTERDWELVDYQIQELAGLEGWKLRGPQKDLSDGRYFTTIGAAHVFGCFVEKPFPDLLEAELGLKALNLGIGGITPFSYAKEDAVVDYINKGKFLIWQVMTARSEANSRFLPTNSVGMAKDRVRGDTTSGFNSWSRIMTEEPENLALYVAQSRNSWISGSLDLIARIKVPIIMFWFSQRPIDVPESASSEKGFGLMGGYPHLIDRSTLDAVRVHCDAYAECFSERDFVFPFVNRFTGEPGVKIDNAKVGEDKSSSLVWTENHYYPSPEMHEDAVPPLMEAIRSLGLM